MKLVYIAGKYNSHAEDAADRFEEIDRNIFDAEVVAIELANEGIGFFCPHTHTNHFEIKSNQGEQFYKDLDDEILKSCHAILMLQSWEDSSGSLREKLAMEAMGRPVFYWPQDFGKLQEWYIGSAKV